MKKLIMAVAALLITVAAYSQERTPRGAEERASMQTQKMTKSLSLTDDQQKKVQDINLMYAKKVDELREANAGDREAMFNGLKKIDGEKDAALKVVLSEKQMADYETLKKERMDKMKDQMKERKGYKNTPNKKDTV
ncbi:hypothetical protein C3K47_07090 [Solitalea longa]|uniref:DUF4890 domain-containing protein n=1 Tax=Solitalea longa TaxID=2079460 RepID=A0A2S5A5C3_9SPHI|nr:hypothetical protein [Solitalea longa]POY37522.1 hypothetical protein C3K47_07090 [Solitalea longa]